MARELVALGGDLADEVGIALGRHPEHEERRAGAELVEEREDRLGLPIQGRPRRSPVRSAEPPVDELVPVLEVEAEQELRHGRNSKIALEAQDRTNARPCSSSPAGGDGGRLRGHRAPEARGQPDPLDADHDALLADAGARSALIGFRLRREEDVRLDIVDSSGGLVREALASQIVPGRVFREFAWDGRDASGRSSPTASIGRR